MVPWEPGIQGPATWWPPGTPQYHQFPIIVLATIRGTLVIFSHRKRDYMPIPGGIKGSRTPYPRRALILRMALCAQRWYHVPTLEYIQWVLLGTCCATPRPLSQQQHTAGMRSGVVCNRCVLYNNVLCNASATCACTVMPCILGIRATSMYYVYAVLTPTC